MTAPAAIVDAVVDFYQNLFDHVFSKPFRARLRTDRLRRGAVERQVQEAADASSQALIRLFTNEALTVAQVRAVLKGWSRLPELVRLEDISNANASPEQIVERLLGEIPCPPGVKRRKQEALYRVALHSTIQVLMLVGPRMAEWQRLSFAQTYELPRKVIARLNEISEQLAFGRSGQESVDERYELTYRDHLLQRFYRVEAGTVRMTTNMDVDLRELFVMPRARARARRSMTGAASAHATGKLLRLTEARRSFEAPGSPDGQKQDDNVSPLLDLVRRHERLIIVGAPGSGKSSFLEWLQLQLASGDQELHLAGNQAIPLLLRVRQLDPTRLPQGTDLVARATGSADRATLMPRGWIQRQMQAGRVLFLLDGLDETDPELRTRHVLPWLSRLCREYPRCHYIVSSRPVGHAEGSLGALGFVECDLLDFDEAQIKEYTHHWCTAVRLARNEPEEEARTAGEVDGAQIVKSFKEHRYIRDLARNPLMLSAICLVNYFEGGRLPEDRVLLYRLCVEGLLHHWDQRRGIQADFGLEEKLRVCREVAIAMQAADRAEWPAEQVLSVVSDALGDAARARNLLEHIRYRTGLLLERRPGVFAFAHLTFQEYLAALAIREGNRLGIDADRLVREHNDGRWHEVIALYCGLAPVTAAKTILEKLMVQSDTVSLGDVLAEAYLSTGRGLPSDAEFRKAVLRRIAIAPAITGSALDRFDPSEAASIAHSSVGKITSHISTSHALRWFFRRTRQIDIDSIISRLSNPVHTTRTNPVAISELIFLAHKAADSQSSERLLNLSRLYQLPGPSFPAATYASQADIALIGMAQSDFLANTSITADSLVAHAISLIRIDSDKNAFSAPVIDALDNIFKHRRGSPLGASELNLLARHVGRLAQAMPNDTFGNSARESMLRWLATVEQPHPRNRSRKSS